MLRRGGVHATSDQHGRRGAHQYQRRAPEKGVLYKVLQEHLGAFVAAANEAGDGLPAFVHKEFKGYLSCGVLAHGFARFKCASCPFARWVPRNCKGRGFCASCGGKRMTSLAANLVDGVIPFVPVRQFVLSLPHRLRYLLAYDHDRCTAVLRIFIRALMSFYRRRARECGNCDRRTGTITFIQRFGSACNLNIHFHVVALDGVFFETADGQLRFEEAAAPTEQELERLVTATRDRVQRHLLRMGVQRDDHEQEVDPVAEASNVLASCYAGSVQGRQVLGRRRGAKLQRVGADPRASWRDIKRKLHAHVDGFDLDASRRIRAQRHDMRGRLEDLLRYCARPPISEQRLSLDANGRVTLRLKTPWHDGSTHIVHEPLDLLSKLAALVPRPQKNLVLYHGVLAANAAWRERVVAFGRPNADGAREPSQEGEGGAPLRLPRPMRQQWAEMMRRAFDIDVLDCPKCGGRLRLIAFIMDRSTLRKLLGHAKLPTEPPGEAHARDSPPEHEDPFDDVA